ncbi:MAG: methyltransferase [Myxococcota bacterium]
MSDTASALVPLRTPAGPRLVRGVLWLHGALEWLAWRLLPPELRVVDAAIGPAKVYALRAAIRVGVFDALAEGPRTACELAAALGLDPDATRRLLRALGARDLVRVDPDGRFTATPTGARCVRGGGVAAFVEYFTAPANLRAWERFEDVLRTGASSFADANGRSVWAWFDEHPDDLARFADAMAFLTVSDAPAIATGYPFERCPDLCDVGGGRGTLAGEILRRHPSVRVTIVDRPGVLPHADRHLDALGVRARVALVAGDFFCGVPAGHAAYLLKNVLHDWDDPRSVEILRVIRAGCAPGTTLLVVEERLDPLEFGRSSMTDIQMLVVCDGGRERSEAEFVALMGAAGFQWIRTWPTGSLQYVFEAIAV